MQIRPATPDDASAIAEILHQTGGFGFQQREDAKRSRVRIAEQLEARLASDAHRVLVAGDDAVLGYLAAAWVPCFFLTGEEAYVTELFVRPTARGAGVGSALLAALESEARARGCARMSLLNFRTKESYQRGFYASRGWEERVDAAPFVRLLH